MLDNIFMSNIKQIEKDIANSKFPKTGKALLRFYHKILSLKLLIGKIEVTEEVYSGKILLRALFEHLIVSYYIFNEYEYRNNDKIGEEYYQEYFIHEIFKQKGYSQKIDNIRGNLTKNVSGLEYLKKKYNELEEVSASQYQEINGIGNKFKIDNILKQLNEKSTTKQEDRKFHDYMLGFLDEYNRLSSYVHGGPFAEKETYDDSNDLEAENNKIKNWTESALNAIEQHILLFLGDEKNEYLLMLKPIFGK